jgi:guanosine-3',5'-bis(diphosphate) 3'-pyrophosphohydrolase
MQTELLAANRLARAAVYACKQHEGQMRDDGVTPYAIHPLRVVEHLREIAQERDPDVLCAAFLHDTIEDTAVTYDTLAGLFGDGVASLVAELTNDNRLPKPQRRAAMIEHIPSLSSKAKRIKLADRLDNISELLRGFGTKEKRERYISETERILEGSKGVCEPLERALRQALSELKDLAQSRADLAAVEIPIVVRERLE